MKKSPCERCGLPLEPHTKVIHQRACFKLPLPKELWQMYTDGELSSVMAQKYGVSPYTIHRRINQYASVKTAAMWQCPRCNQVMVRPNARRHTKVCDRLPLPQELWQRYKNGETATDMAAQYSSNPTTILSRIRLHSGEEEFKEVSYNKATKKSPKKKCECGVILYLSPDKVPKRIRPLDKPMLVDDGSGSCGWCKKYGD